MASLKKKKGKKKEPTAAERANMAAGKGAGSQKGKKGDSVDKAELIVADKVKVDILPPLTEEEKQAKAIEDDRRFRELELQGRKTGVEMMFILREIQGYELWKYMQDKQGRKYGSFDRWLKEAAPLNRSTGYALLKAADKLLPIIPRKELEQYPRYSLDLMSKLPKMKLENPVIRQAAQTKSKKDLVKVINAEAPEAHIESKMVIRIDASTAPIILDAFKACQAVNECEEAGCLEVICLDWLESLVQNNDQYAGMTNRQAWEAWKSQQPEAVKARVTEGEGEPEEVDLDAEPEEMEVQL